MSVTISNDTYFIKYYPELGSKLGNSNTAIILDRLEYWFSKFESGFYKFLEPCKHPCYRAGDSWSEEVGLPRRIFNKAFDLVGVRYKSKSEFLRQPDPFQGKLYACYHDRKTNMTHFVRNQNAVSSIFSKIFSGFKSPEKADGNSRSRNDTFGRSYAYATIDKQINTSSSSLEPIHNQPILEKDESEEMIRIWKDRVGELGKHNPKTLPTLLIAALREAFEGSLTSWEAYCSLIAASEFLMGQKEGKSFEKIWITWALKGQTIQRVRSGEFNKKVEKTIADQESQADQMIKVWENVIGQSEDEIITTATKRSLNKVFKESFDESLEKWQDYCRLIGSSKFLMGEEKKSHNFKKVKLYWASKEETIERIRAGEFSLGDRVSAAEQKIFQETEILKARQAIEALKENAQFNDVQERFIRNLIKNSSEREFYDAFKNHGHYEIRFDHKEKIILIEVNNSFTLSLIDRFLISDEHRTFEDEDGSKYRVFVR